MTILFPISLQCLEQPIWLDGNTSTWFFNFQGKVWEQQVSEAQKKAKDFDRICRLDLNWNCKTLPQEQLHEEEQSIRKLVLTSANVYVCRCNFLCIILRSDQLVLLNIHLQTEIIIFSSKIILTLSSKYIRIGLMFFLLTRCIICSYHWATHMPPQGQLKLFVGFWAFIMTLN